MTRRQRRAFTRRGGEDDFDFVARTLRTLRPRDLPKLLVVRNEDRAQVEAIQLLVQLRLVKKTAQAVRAIVFGAVFLGACIIAAAIVAHR